MKAAERANRLAAMISQYAMALDRLGKVYIGGPQNPNSLTFPAEGQYAGLSNRLTIEQLYYMKNAYIGGGFGPSLSDLLIFLKKKDLNDLIQKQFNTTIASLVALDPYSVHSPPGRSQVDSAYTEIEKLKRLFRDEVTAATIIK
jgi:hypothetical protein